jgi:hypothetical protein
VGCCLVIEPNGSLIIGGYTEGYLPLLPTYTPLQSIYGGGFSDDFLLVLSPPSSPVTPAQTTAPTPETRELPRKERLRPGLPSPVIR